MEKLKLTKNIYGIEKAHNSLDEEFKEFIPKKYTINDLFNMYDTLFYDMVKEGKKHTHFNIIQKSIKYAGDPINSKDLDIEELEIQIQQVENDIWSIEYKHPFFPNGSILRSTDGQKDYYIQSGRKRELNNREAFKLIKRRAGKKNIPDIEFIISPVSNNCLAGILVGPPINNLNDLNIDLMSINKFDDRQFDEDSQ